MRIWFSFLICILLLLAQSLAVADEAAERESLFRGVKAEFDRDDFVAIEKRFAEATAKDERMASGLPKSNLILHALHAAVGRTGPQDESAARWILAKQKAQRWRDIYPTSSLAVFAATSAHTGHAFFHRGERAAVDVGSDKWPLFEAEIKQASGILFSPDSKVSRDAAWHVAVLRLARLQGMDLQAYARFVDEASTQWPYFYEIYFAAAQRFQPRWGGSKEAYEWLANMAVEKTKATDGTALYARVYWAVAGLEGIHDLFSATHADWGKLKRGFDDLIKRYPDNRNYNAYAFFSCLARDAASTKAALEKVGDRLMPEFWDNRQWLNRCRSLARDGQ